MMPIQIERFVVTDLLENCYVVYDETGDALVIDPGGDVETIGGFVEENGLTVRSILNTHGHADHVAGNVDLKRRTGAPIGIHAADAYRLESAAACGAVFLGWDYAEHRPDFVFQDGDQVGYGAMMLDVIHTPGHSEGSCCLVARTANVMFAGDFVFLRAVGRWDLPGGNYALLMKSLCDRFVPLPDELLVYPGHGSETRVGDEKRSNPFVLEAISMVK